MGATDWNIIKPLLSSELLTSATDIKMELKTIAGIHYGIVIVPLLDYKGINIGSIIAVQEFEAYQNQMNAAIVRAIAFSLLQVLVLAGIVIVMINVHVCATGRCYNGIAKMSRRILVFSYADSVVERHAAALMRSVFRKIRLAR